MASNANSTLHVTGLPVGATEDQVRQIFAQYGTVASLTVLPTKPEKPDAAAIVTMGNGDQAQWLVDNVNGKAPTGCATALVIKKKIQNSWGKGFGKGYGKMDQWAWMQMMAYYGYKGGYGKGKGKGGGGLSSFPAEKMVWVGGLPEEGVTFRELQAHFPGSKFATVMKGKGAGTGGVAFATAEEATAAIASLNGSTLEGATIVVDVWTKKEDTAEQTEAV